MRTWEYVVGGSCYNAIICVERLVVLRGSRVMYDGSGSTKDGCGDGRAEENGSRSTDCVFIRGARMNECKTSTSLCSCWATEGTENGGCVAGRYFWFGD